MKNQVIIFDGMSLITIGVKYFFQHDAIIDITKEGVKRLYGLTLFYVHSIEHSEESKSKMNHAISILEQMILDMYGEENGSELIDLTKELYV